MCEPDLQNTPVMTQPSQNIECPYCGETIEILIDDSVEHQRYIEDCSVCCWPIDIEVAVGPDTEIDVVVRTEGDV